jgi:hypothetical protein
MIETREVSGLEPPSASKILLATAFAAVVAAIILVVVVLPAEYKIDPLGTGKALGLSNLAGAEAPAAAQPVASAGDQVTIVPVLHPAGDGGTPTITGAFIAQPSSYRTDSREIVLEPGEGTEIKYNMKKGAGLVYSWKTSSPVLFEFHGEPNVKPEGREGTDYYERYEIDDQVGKTEGDGTFVAPSTGIHGWFWQNTGSGKVTLKLVTAGFYDWIFQNRKDKEMALKTMDPYAAPGHPAVPDEVVH